MVEDGSSRLMSKELGKIINGEDLKGE